ncbi:hypothetical protein [Streptomyces sp. NPDC002851]
MVWDEWEQSKAEAVAQRSAQMQLNGAFPDGEGRGGPAGGTGLPDFASSPAEKRKAADAIDKHLKGPTADAGRTAEETTTAAVKEFDAKDGHGWDTSTALKKAHKKWESQVKALIGRLQSDEAELRRTAVSFGDNDAAVASQFRRRSGIDKY